MDISFFSNNLISFAGSGLLFTFLLIGVLYLGFSMKKSAEKTMLVWFPVFSLAIYFCPIWIVFMKLRDDVEILYRVLWLIPVGVVVCYAFVELICLAPKKFRVLAFSACIILTMLGGKYIYINPQYSKAENPDHIPQTVIDIVEKIAQPGREIRTCYPIELVQYVRQYDATMWLTYGRDALMLSGYSNAISEIEPLLDEPVLDAEKIAKEIKSSYTQYFVVDRNKPTTDSFEKYGLEYKFSVDKYDIYADADAYLGADLANNWCYY